MTSRHVGYFFLDLLEIFLDFFLIYIEKSPAFPPWLFLEILLGENDCNIWDKTLKNKLINSYTKFPGSRARVGFQNLRDEGGWGTVWKILYGKRRDGLRCFTGWVLQGIKISCTAHLWRSISKNFSVEWIVNKSFKHSPFNESLMFCHVPHISLLKFDWSKESKRCSNSTNVISYKILIQL